MTKLDPDFIQKVIEVWKSGADADKLIEIIDAAGLSTADEDIEKVLAAAQAEVAAAISAQELDDKALDFVAGGGTGFCDGTADCDKHFNLHPERTNRCYFANYCDEHWAGSAYNC